MKQEINRYIICGSVLLLTACSAPKINDNLAAKQLPENFDLKRKKESDRLKEENDKRIRAIERKEKADKKKLEDKREEFNKALKKRNFKKRFGL